MLIGTAGLCFFAAVLNGWGIKIAISNLEQEKSEVEKVLKDIEAIPSLEKFIEDHSE